MKCNFKLNLNSNVEFTFENKKIQFKVCFQMQINFETVKFEEKKFVNDGPPYISILVTN